MIVRLCHKSTGPDHHENLVFFHEHNAGFHAAEPGAPFRIQFDTVTKGYDGKYCWAQARAGAIPREGLPPSVVITMNNKWGAEARVYAARILWEKPNRDWDKR